MRFADLHYDDLRFVKTARKLTKKEKHHA